MADFLTAVEYVLGDEGGYSPENQATGDPETNWGITVDIARDYGYTGRMIDLDRQTAIDIYLRKFWVNLGQVADQSLATAIFTYRVNMGTHQGSLILQQALNTLGLDVDEDGQIGPQTINAVNSIDPGQILVALVDRAIGFYQEIVARNPRKEPYLKGWIDRSLRILDLPTVKAGIAGGLAGIIAGIVLLLALRKRK